MNEFRECMVAGAPIVDFELFEDRVYAGDNPLPGKKNGSTAFAEGILQLLPNPTGRDQIGDLQRQRPVRAFASTGDKPPKRLPRFERLIRSSVAANE